MPNCKTESEIQCMRQAGLLVWEAHQAAAALIKPGVSTAEINEAVEKSIAGNGAIPLFKGVPGKVPYPAGACVSLNEEVVHGIPGPRKLREGDIVSIDIGVKLDGWCGDAAVSYPVGRIAPRKQELLDTTEGSLRLAIELMAPGKYWSEIVKQMDKYIRDAGFSIVTSLVGHGIGRQMWEPPQVANYYSPRNPDFELTPGLTFAVEPMINIGASSVRTLADHWTIATTDKKPSAHFEHTIAITDDGPRILTAGPEGQGWSIPV